MVEGREVGGCVRIADVSLDDVQLIAVAVATSAARIETERRWPGEIPESVYGTDEKIIQHIAKCLNVPDTRYEEWRTILQEITSNVISVGYIPDTIEAVAHELKKHSTIAPEVVVNLLILHRGSYPARLRDAHFDAALLERARQIWA